MQKVGEGKMCTRPSNSQLPLMVLKVVITCYQCPGANVFSLSLSPILLSTQSLIRLMQSLPGESLPFSSRFTKHKRKNDILFVTANNIAADCNMENVTTLYFDLLVMKFLC